MKPLRPRQVVHRGSVAAAGFMFELGSEDDATLRAHVLQLWQPGAQLLSIDARWLVLRLTAPVREVAELCAGTPLVRDTAGNLLAAPLDDDERKSLALDPGSLVLVRGGNAAVHALHSGTRVDPAAWLDIESFEWLAAEPLLTPEPEPGVAAMLTDPVSDVREVLGADAPEPAPEQAAVLDALKQRASEAEAQASRPAQPSWAGLALSWLRSRFARRKSTNLASTDISSPNAPHWVARALFALGSLFKRRGQAQHRPRQSTDAQPGTGEAIQTRGAWTALLDWLNTRAAQLLYRSWAGRWIGAAHERYLRAMLERFERGDLREALRYAIPLSDAENERAVRLALGTPAPRKDLTLSARATGATQTVPLEADGVALLRKTYEAAARQLEAQGRIEEAAYAWAELLGDAMTAVALLERHGRLRQAAELAEGRGLAPGLVVRQWFIAGDVTRALALARRHGAFADAIARLEQSARHAEAARGLRVLYGDTLAKAGDYAGAVDVLWPVDEARHLAASFLSRALQAGGAQAGRALARMLAVGLEPAESLIHRVRAMTRAAQPHALAERLAFGHALLAQHPVTPLVRAGAQAALRSLLADAARGWMTFDGQLRRRLTALAADGALRADLPAPTVLTAPAAGEQSATVEQHISGDDRGSIAVEHAALLPNGDLLLALGELGMRLYRPDLRQYTTLLEPAQFLILNPQGTRAIAMAPRGRRHRLARVELTTRRAQPWCDAELERFAFEFDGTCWFVAEHDALLAIDATQDDFRALWRVTRLADAQHKIVEVVAGDAGVEVLTDDACEYFRYERDTLKLRTRTALAMPAPEGCTPLCCLRPGANRLLGLFVDERSSTPTVALWIDDTAVPIAAVGDGLKAANLEARREWCAASLTRETCVELLLIRLTDKRTLLRLVLEGASRMRVWFGDSCLVVADNLGRVRAVSLRDASVVRDLRIAI